MGRRLVQNRCVDSTEARARRCTLVVGQMVVVLTWATTGRAQSSDSCVNPKVISGIGAFAFSTANATNSIPGTPGVCFPPGPPPTGLGPATIANDVWFLWLNDTCTDPVVEIFTCGGTAADTMLATYRGITTCPGPADNAECCNDDSGPIGGFCAPSTQSFVSCETQCCDPVLIQIGTKPGAPPASGFFTIDCGNPSGCGRPQGCCRPDGTCLDIAPDCCTNLGGTPLGLGQPCLGDADGDGIDDACCDPAPASGPDVAIDLSTGLDDLTGTLIPLGADDDTWTLRCAAFPPLGPVPRPAIVVPQNFAWCPPFSASQWIGHSPLPNAGFPGGDYCYWTCFCLHPGFANPSLNFSLRADNSATVYLHNLGPAVSHPLVTAPASSFACNTMTSFSTMDPNLFAPGENCLEVRVNNIGGATGFNLTGQLRVENARCCCAPLPDGSGCRETTCANENALCRPTQLTHDPATGQLVVTRCDCAAAACGGEACDDRRVCNGLEVCDVEGQVCLAGDEPCPAGSVCREVIDQCVIFANDILDDFTGCLDGPDMPLATGCARFDLDDDGDCDLHDAASLQQVFAGD